MSHLNKTVEDETFDEIMIETTIKCEIMSECDVKMEILDGSYETEQEVNGLMPIKEEKNEYVYCTEIEANEITNEQLSPCTIVKMESKSNVVRTPSVSSSNDNSLDPKVSTKMKKSKRTKLCKKISPENSQIKKRRRKKVKNTDDVTYSCGFCFKTFERCKDFFSHMNLHENEPIKLRKAVQEKCEKIETNESPVKSRKDKNTVVSKNNKRKSKKEKKHKIKKESTQSCFDTKKTKPIECDKKNHQCDECGQTFTFDNNLRRHKLRHAGVRYICDFCKKDYLRKSYLAQHINVVHLKIANDTVFKCTVCKKSMNTAYALRWHMQTHTGLKPFKCDICMKGFSNKWNLKVHVKSWH